MFQRWDWKWKWSISMNIVMLIFVSCVFPVHMKIAVIIRANEVKVVDIHPQETIKFQLVADHNTSFIVFQVHTYKEQITLSQTPLFNYDSTVFGRDVGLVTMIEDNVKPISWYVTANGTQLAKKFHVMVLGSVYDNGAPIPGGCNMEFSLKIDPNIHATYDHAMNLVQFQYSRQTVPPSKNCDVQQQLALSYTMYQRYIEPGENGTFDGIEKMLTFSGVANDGNKIETFAIQDKTEQRFAAYTGKGVVYNVLVTQRNNATGISTTAYVPVTSYGCHGNGVECTDLDKDHAFALIVVTLLGLSGLFICFLGHRFFKTELFVFGFLGMFLISYILFARYTTLHLSMMVFLAVICGALGGLVCWVFWYFKGIPIISVLYVGLVGGYLVASLIFNLTPLGSWIWWQYPLNYGLAFATTVLILPVLLLAFTKILNIACCSVVGSYMVVVAIDMFVHGNITQIIQLSIHKATTDQMLKAIVTLPYQWSDLVLANVWILLAAGGATWQHIRERNRAPFPPCPWQQHKLQKYSSTTWKQIIHAPVNPPAEQAALNNSDEANGETDDENQPLLEARRQTTSGNNRQDST